MKVQINIGRNDRFTNQEMELWQWLEYTSSVKASVLKCAKDRNKVKTIAGGVYGCIVNNEESYFELFDVSYGFDQNKFQNMIYKLTEKYNQDSIAVTYIYDESNFLIENLNPKQ